MNVFCCGSGGWTNTTSTIIWNRIRWLSDAATVIHCCHRPVDIIIAGAARSKGLEIKTYVPKWNLHHEIRMAVNDFKVFAENTLNLVMVFLGGEGVTRRIDWIVTTAALHNVPVVIYDMWGKNISWQKYQELKRQAESEICID